jgi:hypothetical protein
LANLGPLGDLFDEESQHLNVPQRPIDALKAGKLNEAITAPEASGESFNHASEPYQRSVTANHRIDEVSILYSDVFGIGGALAGSGYQRAWKAAESLLKPCLRYLILLSLSVLYANCEARRVLRSRVAWHSTLSSHHNVIPATRF